MSDAPSTPAPRRVGAAPSRLPRAKPRGGVPLRWTYAILALAFLFVLMPFLFWQSTWFGRPLSDADLAKNLADREHPRKTQHALSQIADRMGSPNQAVRDAAKQWYPQVAALVAHPTDEIRVTAAWVMGLDNSVAEFRSALLRLLEDPHPLARRNAALSLVRFGDASGLREIRAMLVAYEVRAARDGTLDQRLKPGDVINPGTLLGRIQLVPPAPSEVEGSVAEGVGEEGIEIRARVPGTLERWLAVEGAAVKAGDSIASVSPSQEMVWEGLRALVLVGTAEDLPEVERYARGVAGMPDIIRQQAELTARAIRAREGG